MAASTEYTLSITYDKSFMYYCTILYEKFLCFSLFIFLSPL